MHPDELLPRLTASQLLDWWALWDLDPWGQQRQDFRAAAQINSLGSTRIVWQWPYYETREMIEEEFTAIAEQTGVDPAYVHKLVWGE